MSKRAATHRNSSNSKQVNLRALAADTLYDVVDRGNSLTAALPTRQGKLGEPRDRALLQELCFGVLRYLPRLESLTNALLSKKLTGKTRPVHFLLLVGLYQLLYSRVPAHAAVSETVSATTALNHPKLRGLVNAIMRNFQRQQDTLLEDLQGEVNQFCHPGWYIKRVKAAYPDDWQSILDANNQRPPMWLRVNAAKTDTGHYQQQLAELEIDATLHASAKQALLLAQAQDVRKLPGFGEGDVSVQDAAAQHAALLLAPESGERILDACAAPGGKTAHLLELQPDLTELVAVDLDPERLSRVDENMQRIGLTATLICGDAADSSGWWDGKPFDRILLDAPCSATGVIRRHPDIKWLRRNQDIEELAQLQSRILANCWNMLKPGGTLLYATCSVLPTENREQIAAFLQNTPEAELIPLHEKDSAAFPGWQILPGDQNMDGFYYARLRKPL